MNRKILEKVIVLLLSLALTLSGLGIMLRGDLFRVNYWGGLFFAPFAVIFGLAGFIFAFLPEKPASEEPKKKTFHLRTYFKRRH